jgi:hypothetical protein
MSDFSCFDRHIEDLFGLLEHHRTQGKAMDVQGAFTPAHSCREILSLT